MTTNNVKQINLNKTTATENLGSKVKLGWKILGVQSIARLDNFRRGHPYDKAWACKEQKSTTQDEVEWRDCSSVIYYGTVHTQGKMSSICFIQKKFKYWRIWGHEKRKTSPLMWYGMDLTPSECVSFNRSRSTTNENAHRSHVIA